MGRAKHIWIDDEYHKLQYDIIKDLGNLTEEEMNQIDWDWESEVGCEGVIIRFDKKTTPSSILRKFKTLVNDNEIRLPANRLYSFCGDEYYEYYEDQINSIVENFNFIDEFKIELCNLKELNQVNLQDYKLQETLRRQIFSGAITCLEDYLSTTLIQQTLNNEDNFKRFVKTFRGIKDRKFNLSEIYEKIDEIRDIVKKELVNVIYHNLPKVERMYSDTLGIDFPNIEDLMNVIRTRHDIVHRNGKNKDGEKIEINESLIADIIDKVEKFVEEIDEKIKVHQASK